MTENKNFKTFKSYCVFLFKDSLVTGITPIIESKSWLRAFVKISILVFSVTGFLYQSGQFLQLYWRYTTIEYEKNLNFIKKPAITICSADRFHRENFCTKHPQYCTFFEKSQINQFCKTYDLYCKDPDKVFLAESHVNDTPAFMFQFNSTKEFGMQAEEVITSCKWYRIDEKSSIEGRKFFSKCSDAKFVRQLTEERIPASCYVLDSAIGNPSTLNNEYQEDLVLRLELKWMANSINKPHLNDFGLLTYYISLHSPAGFKNPFLSKDPYLQGFHYKSHVYQTDTVRLPPPYATQCKDYLKDWVENGGRGPLNRKECQDACATIFQSRHYGCIFREVDYPHEENVCPRRPPLDLTLDAQVRECMSHCKSPCWETEYVTKSDISCGVSNADFKRTFGTPYGLIIDFHVHAKDSTLKEYRPKYESIELFSYIGGYIGMWLGWSIIALLDFFGAVVRMCKYPFIGRKQQIAEEVRFNREAY